MPIGITSNQASRDGPRSTAFAGEPCTVSDVEKRLELDLWYIDNWSFALDFKIALMTVIEIAPRRECLLSDLAFTGPRPKRCPSGICRPALELFAQVEGLFLADYIRLIGFCRFLRYDYVCSSVACDE